MGFGDEIIGAAFARGAKKRGKLIAFGDGQRIKWSKSAWPIFENNPNVARPGEERAFRKIIEWVVHYSGQRAYNIYDRRKDRWVWNYNFRVRPGELFFTEFEQEAAWKLLPSGYVLIEPNVPMWKPSSVNKLWHGYQQVADTLRRDHIVVQFEYGGKQRLNNVNHVNTTTIRQAMALLARASLYVGAEGGMHHAAAALGVRGVVLFGGFSPPQVLGYDTHINLTGGAEACGSRTYCQHCQDAMKKITAEEVIEAARQ